jgi:hypothetical protein
MSGGTCKDGTRFGDWHRHLSSEQTETIEGFAGDA